MSDKQEAASIDSILTKDAEMRFTYLVKEVIENREIWLLTDEHGCVMLNSEDEDCVPVWPSQAHAQAWATQEWQTCKAEAVSLSKWHSHWTRGLEEDELAIVVFPDQQQEGLVIYPDEFDLALKKQAKKVAQKS
jgi:hypothetical protein